MGQLRWRFAVAFKRLMAIPGKAKRMFWEGWDREKSRQSRLEPPPAAGFAIQVNGVSERALMQTASAIDTLLKVLPSAVSGVDLWRLNRALDNLTIDWVRNEVPEYRMLHQEGPRWVVKVQWMETVWESQLFHALLHFVNMSVRLLLVKDEERDQFIRHDHDHLELDYWGLELVLCQREYHPD